MQGRVPWEYTWPAFPPFPPPGVPAGQTGRQRMWAQVVDTIGRIEWSRVEKRSGVKTGDAQQTQMKHPVRQSAQSAERENEE